MVKVACKRWVSASRALFRFYCMTSGLIYPFLFSGVMDAS